MKLTFVKSLETGSIIAKDILNGEGKVLLKAGTKLSKEYINLLKNKLVLFVYVEDKALEDIKTDPLLDNLKQKTLENMPNIFQNIISGNYVNSRQALYNVEELVNHIIEEGTVNTNLYEVKSYDNYTYIHCVDTAIMAVFLGMAFGYNSSRLRELSIAAILHDIGKTKVPHELINKKGPLTREEFEIVKKHTVYGREILEKMHILSDDVLDGVLQHHERMDGLGYPYGLRGTEISEFARIISICDVFTAVSANRSYRFRFEPNEAYELILSGADTMFDRRMVNKFRETFFVYPLGCCVKLSNGIEGYVAKQNKFFADRPVIRVVYDDNTKASIDPYEINLLQHPDIVVKELI